MPFGGRNTFEDPSPSWMEWVPLPPVEALAEWKKFTYKERKSRWDHHARKLRDAQKKAGIVLEAKPPKAVPTQAVPSHAPVLTQKQELQRLRELQARMDSRIRHSTGCVVDGCLMAPTTTPAHVCLLEQDHIIREEKESGVCHLRGPAREAELQKTQCLCVWHHFTRTREQRGDRPMAERTDTDTPACREVARWKTKTGCEHPLHSSMPYAAMIPSPDSDPTAIGFLDVSHVVLGQTPLTGAKYTKLLRDLESGDAVVHCKFCHKLYTLCERRHFSDAPLTQYEFALCLKMFPAFVHHFDIATGGFDWVIEKERRGFIHREGIRKREERNKEKKKRKREEGQ